MLQNRKILLILFYFLLLVVILESVYLLVSNKPKKLTNQFNLPSQNPQVSLSPNQAFAINPRALRYLQVLPASILSSSILTNVYQGEILEIDTKSGVLPPGFQYQLKLTLKNNDSSPTPFYFNQNNLKRIKGTPISSLKVGDQIKLEETIDLREDFSDNRKEIIITKI